MMSNAGHCLSRRSAVLVQGCTSCNHHGGPGAIFSAVIKRSKDSMLLLRVLPQVPELALQVLPEVPMRPGGGSKAVTSA